MTTTRTNKTETQIAKHAFGTFDRLGREIGVNVYTFEADYEASENRWGYTYQPGHYFVARCQSSRNGSDYNSSQDEKHFRTAEERDAYVTKRIADSRKKATK